MKRCISGMIGLALVWGLMTVAVTVAAAADLKQAAEDWKEMDSLLTERETFLYQNVFDKNPEDFANRWLKFSELFRKKEAEFVSRYGSERNDLNELFKTVPKPDGVTRESYQFVNEFLGADIDQLHKDITDWAEAIGRDQYLRWEQLKDPDPKKVELKYKYARRALLGYRVAAQLQPDKDYGEVLKKCEDAEEEMKSQFQKTLDSFTWPEHNSDFDGPGKPNALAAAALDFLRENPKWSKPEYDDEHIPFAASISGSGWDVWKKAPLTDDPTQYSLDVTVAFTGNNDPDIVYVYEMTFYTAEEGGVKKGLPFRYASSKQYQKHQMLKKSIPKKFVYKPGAGVRTTSDDSSRDSAKTGDQRRSTDSESSGSSFGFWRLIFGVLLILGGIIGAKTMVISSVPAMKTFVDKLTGFSMPIGLFLILIGVLGFLCNLFRFVPHASFLTQAAGILLGIILLKKNPGPIPLSYLNKIALPNSIESPVALAALVLGFLHLIIGGLPLL